MLSFLFSELSTFDTSALLSACALVCLNDSHRDRPRRSINVFYLCYYSSFFRDCHWILSGISPETLTRIIQLLLSIFFFLWAFLPFVADSFWNSNWYFARVNSKITSGIYPGFCTTLSLSISQKRPSRGPRKGYGRNHGKIHLIFPKVFQSRSQEQPWKQLWQQSR